MTLFANRSLPDTGRCSTSRTGKYISPRLHFRSICNHAPFPPSQVTLPPCTSVPSFNWGFWTQDRSVLVSLVLASWRLWRFHWCTIEVQIVNDTVLLVMDFKITGATLRPDTYLVRRYRFPSISYGQNDSWSCTCRCAFLKSSRAMFTLCCTIMGIFCGCVNIFIEFAKIHYSAYLSFTVLYKVYQRNHVLVWPQLLFNIW